MRVGWLILSIAATQALAACDETGTANLPSVMGAPLVQTAAASPTRLALDAVRTVAGGTPTEFFVTPRWSPFGEQLLLSGYRGIGLYVAASSGSSVRVLDPAYQGPARWSPDGRSVLHPALLAQDAFVELDSGTGGARNVPRPSFLPAPVELFSGTASAEVLRDENGVRVLFEEYEGRLVVESAGRRTVLADEDAWGPRTAPDGRHMAWCTGHLIAAQLHVATTNGSVVFAGSGTHAAWLPDGSGLVFAVPAGGIGPNGGPQLVAAELWLLDLHDGSLTQLTDTPGGIEMEPAVSPDGTQLAFADWNTGAIRVGRLGGGGTARTGGGR